MNYLCKYAPVELFQSFGEEVSYKNPSIRFIEEEKVSLHRNVCGFCRALDQVYAQGNQEDLILTSCCNSIDALNTTLKERGVKTWMVPIPFQQEDCHIQGYAKVLKNLAKTLEKEKNQPFDPQAFRNAFPLREEKEPVPYLALLGSRLPQGLLDYMSSRSQLPIKNYTCTSDRNLGQPPEADDFDELMDWYAQALLRQRSCMRMADNTDHRHLFNDPFLRGGIFCTVSFCDFYAFEYAYFKNHTTLPVVKIETDYTDQESGQIETRLEAFFETIKGLGYAQKINSTSAKEGPDSKNLERIHFMNSAHSNPSVAYDRDHYYAGIDSGSTSTNCVIIKGDQIVASGSRLTGVDVQKSADLILTQCINEANLKKEDILSITTTGYGRNRIDLKDNDVTEISCHAAGAHFLNPKVHTVIDIGGQDSKVIHLDDQGRVINFAMNDKCAAGTGKFLELMAMTLGMTVEEMSKKGLEYKREIKISSMCSVFAQSEVVSLIADGYDVADIIHGLNVSVANKVLALGGRRGMEEEFMMTGGVARNQGVREVIEKKVGRKLTIHENPDICGAIGAALYARGGI